MSLKVDAIPILAGSSNYSEWEQQIKHFLQSEDLYSHIEGEEDNPNAAWPASYPQFFPKIQMLLVELSSETGGKMTA